MLNSRKKWGVVLCLVCAIGLISVKVSQRTQAHNASSSFKQTATKAAAPQVLTLDEETIKNAQIETRVSGPQMLDRILELPGQINVNQDKLQAIVTKMPGVVIKANYHVGQKVRQGEVMAIVESRELADLKLEYFNSRQQAQQAEKNLQRETQLSQNIQHMMQRLRQGGDPGELLSELQGLQIGEAKARLITDLGNLRLAYQTWQREQNLFDQQLTSELEVQQALRNYENAKVSYLSAFEEITWQREQLLLNRQQAVEMSQSTLKNASAKLQMFGLTTGQIAQLDMHSAPRYEIRSPLTGTVVARNVLEGQGVQAESSLFTVADLSEVWAEMHIYEKDLNKVRTGLNVQVKAPDLEQSMKGVIRHIQPVVDPQTRAAEAYAYLANPQGIWKPGMYVTVAVSTDTRQVPLAVHNSAIQTLDDQEVVFVRAGNQFHKRPVTLGEQDETWVEILSGLKPGDNYVAHNSFIIKSEFIKLAEGEE